MHKYLFAVASELDGHAGAESYYVQTEKVLTREDKLDFIDLIARAAVDADKGEKAEFVESTFSAERAGDEFYGVMAYTFVFGEGDTFEDEADVSIRIRKLPSRMTKGTMYAVESRTG